MFKLPEVTSILYGLQAVVSIVFYSCIVSPLQV